MGSRQTILVALALALALVIAGFVVRRAIVSRAVPAGGPGAVQAPTAPESERPESPGKRSFALTGVVRKVDRETGVVSIRHEAIPGYMSAMTMPFDLSGQAVLEDLQPGDKVRGTLEVTADDFHLTNVEITELALAPDPEPVEPATLALGQPVPDFAMTTQEGNTLSLSDLRGRVVVLTFIYTRCPVPNFCPLMDRRFGELADLLRVVPERAAQVRLLSVSFDPEHDTPEVLAHHAQLRGAEPPLWTFAVASHDELRKVAPKLGLFYGPDGQEIRHALSTSVIGPDGRLVRLERGNDWTARDLFKTVVETLPDAN